MQKIAIFGMGAVTPLGNYGEGNDQFWQSLLEGKTAFSKFSFSPLDHGISARIGGEVDFDPVEFSEKLQWKNTPKFSRLDKVIQLGLSSAHLAIQQIDLKNVNREEIAVVAGTGLGGGRTMEDSLREFDKRGGNRRLSFSVINVMHNGLAGWASIHFGFSGPSQGISAACASSAQAVVSACNLIKLGQAKAVLVIGAEACATPHYVATFDQLDALSTSDSLTASKPFGKDRDGFVLSEGSSSLVIADLSWGISQGWFPVAEIVGYAANSGANNIVNPYPPGAAKCMIAALEDAGVEPGEIDYINTHGTSTKVGDVAEAKAIEEVFGDSLFGTGPTINSSKALLGHMLGAAGTTELIITAKSLIEGVVHPMGDYELDQACVFPQENHVKKDTALNIVTQKTKLDRPNFGLSNAFGFGDHNVSIVVAPYCPA